MRLLVSACLLGLNTRYDGSSTENENLFKLLNSKGVFFLPLCAEQLGGLPTPRQPAEIEKGYSAKDVLGGKAKIFTKEGRDVTVEYLRGAKQVLDICKRFNITHAFLQERSPSCGFNVVYSGDFSNKLVSGRGILTQLLIDDHIEIVKSLKRLEELLK
jgi:uncharacterized protein YbbK (DUF523 family)